MELYYVYYSYYDEHYFIGVFDKPHIALSNAWSFIKRNWNDKDFLGLDKRIEMIWETHIIKIKLNENYYLKGLE